MRSRCALVLAMLLSAGCSADRQERADRDAPAATVTAANTPQGTSADRMAHGYSELETYRKVDLSFSDLPIDTTLRSAAGRLSRIDENNCVEMGECDYRDANGVRHFFWDNLGDELLVIKIVQASEMQGRSIGALGIGMARTRSDVLANVRRFLPGVELDCDPADVSGNVGPDECSGSIGEGWFQIGFDEAGLLQAVRFDGYQFT